MDGKKPAVSSVAFDGTPGSMGIFAAGETIKVNVTFGETVQVSGKPTADLRFRTSGSSGTTKKAVYKSGTGTTVLKFEYVVESGIRHEALQIGPLGGNIKDTAGNPAVLTHSGVANADRIKVDAIGPKPVRAGIISTAPAGGNVYRKGDKITFGVAFNENVKVAATGGNPTLGISVGSAGRQATYDSSVTRDCPRPSGTPATRCVMFSYAVQAGDVDLDGVTVPANGLNLNGGGITDLLNNAAASLAHKAVPDPNALSGSSLKTRESNKKARTKVNGLTAADLLVLSATSVTVTEGASATYDVKLKAPPAAELKITPASSDTGAATVSTAATDDKLTFTESNWNANQRVTVTGVQDVDADDESVTVTHALSGSSTGYAGSSASSVMATVTDDEGMPTVVGAPQITSAPAASGSNTYGHREKIKAAISFSEAITVTGTPQLTIKVGAADRIADCARKGDSSPDDAKLECVYTVADGDADADGISIEANKLSLPSSPAATIKDSASNDADLDHSALTAQSGHKVDGSAPEVASDGASVEISSTPAAGQHYIFGEKIVVTVTFTESVTVEGSPRLKIKVGANDRWALYSEGDGTDSLKFSYTVADTDTDTDGVEVVANSLELNGGKIRDAANSADLGHDSIEASPSHKVDGVRPKVVGKPQFTGTPTAHSTYAKGEKIKATVTFSKAVTVTGTPGLAIKLQTVDPETHAIDMFTPRVVTAQYKSGTGTASLTFEHEVVDGDYDENGISFDANAISGGTIKDANGNAAVLTHGSEPNDATRKVDGIRPAVKAVSIGSSPSVGNAYGAGETIKVAVQFREKVAVTGTPQLNIDIGGTERAASYARRNAAMDTLEFEYAVAATDGDADGISIKRNALALNSGTIKDLNGNAANLAHAALGRQSGHRVNGASAAGDVTISKLRLTIAEGSKATYTVRLGKAPVGGNVTVTPVAGDTAAVSVSPSSLSFTGGASGNWNRPQTVTVIAKQDADQSDENFQITHAVSGANYGSVTAPAIQVRVSDDDTNPSFLSITETSSPASGDTYLLGETIQITVLYSKPVFVTGNPHFVVYIGGAGKQAGLASGSGTASLVFEYAVQAADRETTRLSYVSQAIQGGGTIKDADGNDAPRSHAGRTTYELSRNKVNGGQSAAGVSVSKTEVTVPEGDSRTYTVRLLKAPTTNVTIAVSVAGDTDLTVDPSSLTFTTGNWNSAQTVTVSAAADADAVNGTATVSHAATSDDASYQGISIPDVTAFESDSGGLPAKPGNFRALPANGKVTLSWDDPEDAGIGRWEYRQKAGMGEFGGWIKIPNSGAGTKFHDVAALDNGTAYTFQVRAVNAAGNGPPSDEATATPSTRVAEAPDQVTGVSVEAGAGQLTVTWNAVAGATGYKVQWKSGNQVFATGRQATSTTTSHTIADLTPGTEYTVRVIATKTNAPDGTASVEATGTPAFLAPAAPTGLTAAKDGRFAIDLSWTAPATASARAAVTGYKVEWSANGTDGWTALTTTAVGTTTYKDSGLGAGTTRHYRVLATSAAGDSAWSSSASATTDANAAPAFDPNTATRSVAENAAAGTDVGAVIPAATDADSDDTLTYAMSGTDAGSFDFDADTRQITVKSGTSLDYEAKSSYSVTVTASDEHSGSGSVAVTINVTDVNEPPSAPTGLSVSAQGATVLRATWVAPGNGGKPDISGYDVQYRQGTSGTWSAHTHSGTAVTADIGSLTANTAYQVRVRAKNDEGDGAWTAAVSGTTSALTAPVAPSGLTAAKDGRFAIDLSWTAPAADAARAAVTGYKIEWSANGTDNWTALATVTGASTVTHEDSGLGAGTTRHYRVLATSAAGDSAWSSSASATTDANAAPAFDPNTATRSVAENATAETDVGAVIPAATDADSDDTLTYAMSGTDAGSFEFDATTRQITVKSGTSLDYEAKSSYSVTVTASDGHGGNGSVAVTISVTNVDEAGTVTFGSTAPAVGTALTARVSDPDGNVSSVTWQWAKSDTKSGTYANISRATSASYTPATADAGKWLRATASYTDAEGSGKSAAAVAAAAVMATDTTAPTVTAASTGFFSDAGAATALTGPQNAAATIYTKVTFSEDMKHVKGDAAAARPELFRRIDTTDTQYDILDNADTLASGDCKPDHATNTNVYVCLYTVGASDTGAFTLKAGMNSVDKAGNALAAAYVHTATLALDTTAPAAPSALALASGTTSPGNDATPEIEVTVGETGGKVTLYSDAACATAASAATDVTDTSSPYKVTVDATAIATDGSVTFHARHADAAGNVSACSTATVAYVYDGTDPGITFPAGAPTTGAAATITLTDAGAKIEKYGAIAVDGTTGAATDCDTATEVGSALTTLPTPAASVSYMYTPPADSAGKKICVYAEDAAGNSDSSLWSTAIAQAVPAKPTGLMATPGDAQVTLSWTDPSDSTITKHQYRQKAGTGNYGSWTDIANSAPGEANATSYTVTSLVNGTAYRFKLRAVNAGGNGPESDEAGPATPVAVDNTGPTVSAIAITSSVPAGQGGSYRIGDTIEVTATFSEALVVTGSPVLKIRVGTGSGSEKTATCARKGATGDDAKKLVCSYTVASGDEDTDGISIEANKLSGTIKDAADNAATLTYTAIAAQSGHTVDGVRPTITKILPDTRSAIYAPGNLMRFYVEFSESVDIVGEPTLSAKIGAATRTVTYDQGGGGQGNKEKRFEYTVQAGDEDGDGVSVDAGSLALPSGASIKDGAGNDATLSHSGMAAQSHLRVDAVKPAIAFPSGAPTVGTAATITLTDATAKVAKHAVLELDGSATNADGCDDPATDGDDFSTTAVSPAVSPEEVSHTPATAGKKICVYAEDAAGNRHAALWTTAIVQAAPAKPAGLAATAGNAKVDLSWTDPGDSTITKHQYRQKAGTAAWGSWTDIASSAPGESNATSYTVTSLMNGTAYRFRIRAVNGGGNGPQSAVAGPVTPAAPATTAPGGGAVWSATLTVDNASERGGNSAYGCDNVPGFNPIDSCSTATVLTDDDFDWPKTGGTTYTIDRVYYVQGSSLFFGFSGVTSSAAKTALTGLTLTVGSGATASTFAIADAGASGGTGSALTWTNHGLSWSEGDTVALKLTAPAATTKPAKPAGLAATAGDAKVDLSWTDPGDSSITRYQYRQRAGAAAWGAWTDIASSAPGGANATSYTVTGLMNGTAYRFRIRAVNGAGNGAQSAVAAATPAGAATTAPGGGIWSATLTVDQSSSLFGCSALDGHDRCSSALTDDDFDHGGATYRVRRLAWLRSANALQLELATAGGVVSGSALKTALGSLTLNADGAAFAVSASGAGPTIVSWPYDPATDWTDGQTVSVSLAAAPAARPAKPSGLAATAGDAQVTLSWTDPGDSSITGYQYRQKAGGAAWGRWTDIASSAPGGANAASYTVTGLANCTAHLFRVRAVNAAGRSPASDEAGPATPQAAPAAPPSGQGKLVGNVASGAACGYPVTFKRDVAQQFITGRHPGGYTLTHLDLAMENGAANEPGYAVTVHAPLSSDRNLARSTLPGKALGTLTTTASLPQGGEGFVRFAAPAGGIDLEPGRPYVLVIDVGEGASRRAKVSTAARGAEDGDGVAHWIIQGISRTRKAGSTGRWSNVPSLRLRMAVYGTAKPAPPPDPALVPEGAVWSASLTVQGHLNLFGGALGCGLSTGARCSVGLSSNEFTHDGVRYRFDAIQRDGNRDTLQLSIVNSAADPEEVLEAGAALAASGSLTLHVDGRAFPFADARLQYGRLHWDDAGLAWRTWQRVSLALTDAGAPSGAPPAAAPALEWARGDRGGACAALRRGAGRSVRARSVGVLRERGGRGARGVVGDGERGDGDADAGRGGGFGRDGDGGLRAARAGAGAAALGRRRGGGGVHGPGGHERHAAGVAAGAGPAGDGGAAHGARRAGAAGAPGHGRVRGAGRVQRAGRGPGEGRGGDGSGRGRHARARGARGQAQGPVGADRQPVGPRGGDGDAAGDGGLRRGGRGVHGGRAAP